MANKPAYMSDPDYGKPKDVVLKKKKAMARAATLAAMEPEVREIHETRRERRL